MQYHWICVSALDENTAINTINYAKPVQLFFSKVKGAELHDCVVFKTRNM